MNASEMLSLVRLAETKYQSSRSILHGLKTTDRPKVDRQADQHSVTAVQPAEN